MCSQFLLNGMMIDGGKDLALHSVSHFILRPLTHPCSFYLTFKISRCWQIDCIVLKKSRKRDSITYTIHLHQGRYRYHLPTTADRFSLAVVEEQNMYSKFERTSWNHR